MLSTTYKEKVPCRGTMARSCTLASLVIVLSVAGPSACHGISVQHVFVDLIGWARHELAALTHLLAPSSEDAGFGPQCVDAQGMAVEWWVAIKPPNTTDLLYIDSQNPQADPTQWRFSFVSGHSNNPVERTLQQLQSSSGGRALGHVMYSDDAPQPDGIAAADSLDAALTRGRGVLGFGTSRGFWLTHSLPSFPTPPDSPSPAGIPSRALPHAHSLLCISAAVGQLRGLAGALKQNRYNVYSRALPSDVRAWSAEELDAAAQLLLQDPANSADDEDDAEPDVVMNEISAIDGERFVILGNNGSRSQKDIVDSILGSFFGNPMLRTSQFWPRPCTASFSGYPNFQPRHLREEASGQAWNASLERSHWQISLSDGQAPATCQMGLWDPDNDKETGALPDAQLSRKAGSTPLLEQGEEAVSTEQMVTGQYHAAPLISGNAEVAAEGRASQIMTVPVISSSRRRLLERGDSERDRLDSPGRTLSEFIAYKTESFARPLTSLAQQLAHRLLGSPEMAAELSMRRSMLSIPSVASAGQSVQRRSFLDWLPASVWPLFEVLRGRHRAVKEQALYHPQDDSYYIAAAEILDMRNNAIKEQLAFENAKSIQQEVEEGLAMELRLTGASSVVPKQTREGTVTQHQEAGMDQEEDCTGALGVIAGLKCWARSLQQQALALEERVDRLEEAAEGETSETEQMPGQGAMMGMDTAGYSLRQRWENYVKGHSAQQVAFLGGDLLREGWGVYEEALSRESAGCAQAASGGALPEEKYAVCFTDRGRSLQAGGLPGGAVCFGGHEGLWHALRALVRTYEYCG